MITMTQKCENSGPLAGVRVLDFTSVVMGPFATQILAQLGAEIIKVETPQGDNMRHVGPMKNPSMGHIFLHANAGKKGIVLDLKKPEGLEAALKLTESCDVVISNVRPMAMKRLGLDYKAVEARNSKIIYVSCCGFDQRGPDATKPAYDDLIQGAIGIPWLMEQYGSSELMYAPITLADRVTGLHAVYAVTAALYARSQTGKGQEVVVPMFEAMTQLVLGDHMAGLTFESPEGGAGYARLLTHNRKPYRTQDGMLCVLIYNDKHWRSFFEAIGEADGLGLDPRFMNHSARAENINDVYAEVSRIMKTRTTDQWCTLLDQFDIPNMPMNSPEDLLTNEQLRASGFMHRTLHPTEGWMHAMAHPTQWSATPPANSFSPAPRLGEHTREVLASIGYTHQQIEDMSQRGACQII